MSNDTIDFISSYCDRWCERCRYTARCSAYACEIAIAMCGDVADGLELAIGEPQPVDGEADQTGAVLASEFFNAEMSAEERAEFDRHETTRDARLAGAPLATMAMAFMKLSHQWLNEHGEALRATADPVLAEALDIVAHDSACVSAKLHRALDGRDRHRYGEAEDEHPVQNDWNGSAKVALISLERSDIAWCTIGQTTGDQMADTLAASVSDLRHVVLDEFPRAMSFVRPGFDEPWRRQT
jgi:hypothetical protein